MDPHPYDIQLDSAQRLMTITFKSVFWDDSVSRRFVGDCLGAAVALAAQGEHVILVDLRTAVLQSQVVYEKMKALIGGATARRVALVATSPLARMQTKRLQLRDNIVLFASMDEARDWLFADEARVAA